MRATTIPAQITTVEDKIAGNLNMTQVALLGIPILFTAASYTVFPPTFHFAFYKLPIILLVAIFCIILSLKIKGKVILNWLLVVLAYNLRPRYYVFDKNDEYLRNMFLPEFEKSERKLFNSIFNFKWIKQKQDKTNPAHSFSIGDLLKLKDLIHNPNYSFSFKVNRKGGINVIFGQIKH